jgi:hypothetical protein
VAEIPFKKAINKHVTTHNQTTYTPYYRGTPDHWYSGKRDLWIEYKFVKFRPKITSWENILEPMQWEWCNYRFHEGRNIWVVLGYKDGKSGIILRIPEIEIQRVRFDTFLQPIRQIANEINNFCLSYG